MASEGACSHGAESKKGPEKSSILFDIKPWDDETDFAEMEKKIREIQCDGLMWSKDVKILPIGYGIQKMQIACVVEDDKVTEEYLEECIMELEDFVQSVDIVAKNRIDLFDKTKK